ncbi:DUF2950 family protein [Mesorhizobium sp. LHD-90]|uniref:DUF2950 family protein n=1 Tax=Mesorhizobium sp. LHD-90 TaxID=3071414 RepID=UPI0027E1A5B8|nr:DUF2950 family protein [Mesorhizobium sp. LHD-90]MDQ6436378.1 DUF2950 family protein [Mesorhizobium sp. LHD-90]
MNRYFVTATLALSLSVPALSAGSTQEAEPSTVKDFESFVGEEPPTFATVEELVEAFRKDLAANDKEAVASLLGLAPAEVMKSKEIDESFAEIREAAAVSIAVKETDPDLRTLVLGDKLWPFPFPVVQAEGKWAFDTIAGLEEVINRRIGDNELTTVANLRAYVDAQEDYMETDWDEDGVGEYAQKLISTPETYDGLYWEPGDGVPESPFGSLISQAELATAAGDGYFGYRYRILNGQGANVAGGQHDYVINGNMIGGFALLAAPAQYDRTGIMTFVVNQYDTVYEKDLGPGTAALAEKITAFDPDDGWAVVNDPGD